MDEARRAARWRRRRIIYNNDGDDAIYARDGAESEHDVAEGLTVRTSGELMGDFLQARSTPLIGSQVDSNWFCSCMAGLTFSHHTKLGGFIGRGMPQELIDQYGKDTVQVQQDFSREHGMEFGWSLRMNDIHDSYAPGSRRWTSYGLAPFKREHPECMMGELDDFESGEAWSGLDYGAKEVRDHYFAVIEEVAENYDVDVIAMEFFKYHPYFRESREGLPVSEEHVEVMNDFVRRIRRMADEVGARRGRPLLLAAHTPATLEDSLFVGVDLETWLGENLIDKLMPGGNEDSPMCDSFRDIIDFGHRHEVPVYPCLQWAFWGQWVYLALGAGEHRAFSSWLKTLYGGQPERLGKPTYIVVFNEWEGRPAVWRAVATNVFNDGADGVYVFNPGLGVPETWFEIGDPETMAGKEKLFGVDRFLGDEVTGERGRFETAENVGLTPGRPVELSFQVGDDLSSADPQRLRFRLHLWDLTDGDELNVALNNRPLEEVQSVARTAQGGGWLECGLDPSQVRRGGNTLELKLSRRDESMQTPILVDGVQLHVAGA